MNIAITGAGGFLGTEILRQLSSYENIKVYAFTFEKERKRENFLRANNIIPVDNEEAISFDYSDIDVLLNCAFPRNVDDESFSRGLDFIQHVLLKAFIDHVKAVINISSQSVYSQKRKGPAKETTSIILESKYAVGKYGVELLINSLFRNIPHTNLRMASLIGAGFDQRITNKFVAKVIHGEQITITGGEQLFGFMDVRDAADGIITVMNDVKKWNEAYNFGTNEAYSLMDIAQCVYEEGIRRGFQAPGILVSEDNLWQNTGLICDMFYDEFGWKPKYHLIDTLGTLYDNICSHS